MICLSFSSNYIFCNIITKREAISRSRCRFIILSTKYIYGIYLLALIVYIKVLETRLTLPEKNSLLEFPFFYKYWSLNDWNRRNIVNREISIVEESIAKIEKSDLESISQSRLPFLIKLTSSNFNFFLEKKKLNY